MRRTVVSLGLRLGGHRLRAARVCVGAAVSVGLLVIPVAAQALSAGPPPAVTDLSFTVVSVSPVYVTDDGSSVAFATLRNDTGITLSLATGFTVTFLDASGTAVGSVSAGSGNGLSSALRAVPPGQIGDVSARLPGVAAATAMITDRAASGSPFSDPRLPLASVPTRTVASPGADSIGATVVNTSGYPDRLHVVIFAEDASDNLLGALTTVPPTPVPSGDDLSLTMRYQRLPGEPVADHYDVVAEGLPDGTAATTVTSPTVVSTPISGVPTTLHARLLDGAGVAVTGAVVELIGRRPGKASTVLARVVTDAHGAIAVRLVLPPTGELQLVFAGDPVHAPAGTGDFSFRLRPRLSATAPRSIQEHAAAVVRATIPDYPGERLILQELHGTRWRVLRSAVTDHSGAVRFILRPAKGHHTYRLIVQGTQAHLPATSDKFALQVI